jgi:hypothetical protein
VWPLLQDFCPFFCMFFSIFVKLADINLFLGSVLGSLVLQSDCAAYLWLVVTFGDFVDQGDTL